VSLKSDLYAYLNAEGALTAVATGGIHPGIAEQGTARPYITWSRIGEASTQNRSGPEEMAAAVFQFDCWADSSVSLDATSEALRGELDGYARTMGSTDVRRIQVTNESDGIEQPDDGREAPIYRTTFTVTIWYARSVPVF
jgi:hypothetical protein